MVATQKVWTRCFCEHGIYHLVYLTSNWEKEGILFCGSTRPVLNTLRRRQDSVCYAVDHRQIHGVFTGSPSNVPATVITLIKPVPVSESSLILWSMLVSQSTSINNFGRALFALCKFTDNCFVNNNTLLSINSPTTKSDSDRLTKNVDAVGDGESCHWLISSKAPMINVNNVLNVFMVSCHSAKRVSHILFNCFPASFDLDSDINISRTRSRCPEFRTKVTTSAIIPKAFRITCTPDALLIVKLRAWSAQCT